MTEQLNESSGRIGDHEPRPTSEKIGCSQAMDTIDIREAQKLCDMRTDTCKECKRCI